MKVCWLSNYFSPYKIELFEQLSKHVQLTALMMGGKDLNRNDEWKLNENHHFKVVYLDNSFNSKIKELAQENDVLVDSLYLSRYGIKAVAEFKKQNKTVYMHADGGIAKNRGIMLNKLMSYLMNKHDCFISSSKFTNKYFEYYGVDKNKIYNYRFTSLTEQDIKNNKELLKSKEQFRKGLGIDNKFTLISVGQPIRRKGFDILLNSYIMTGNTNDINLYIIGGKPENEVSEIVKYNNLVNVHFVGLMSKEELKKYYAAADGFILCTREDIWGLVIQEAMSFGLPVITSDNCIAGLHFNDISESVLINEVDDLEGYSKKINYLLNSNELREKLSKESLEKVKDYTIENSSEDIIKILNTI